MKIPESFRTAVNNAYTGQLSLNDLIKSQEMFLRGLARYALRYQTAWYMSDEDDLFQNACMWLVRAMWDWDETKSDDLANYVVYNIGCRLGNLIKIERRKRRHPDPNHSRKIDLWGPTFKDSEGIIVEETIPCNSNPEHAAAIKEAFERADREMTEIAWILVHALIETNGNIIQSARLCLKNEKIKTRFGPDEQSMRYAIRKKIMPEIFHFLSPMDIIPSQ